MIILGNGDSLRGSASVANVVDFSFHGMAGSTIAMLGEGQLSDSDGQLYPATAIVVVKSMVLVNTHSAAVTINLTLLKSGSTARRIVPKDLSLGIGYALYVEGSRFFVIDASGNLQTETASNISTDQIWTAAGDLVQGAGNDAGEVLSLGAAMQRPRVNAGAIAIEWANETGITTKTTTATLTLAEAGMVLVSAATAYTITLPTAVGNTGLAHHFKKTDANYNLITLDGDGTETFNYENSTAAPVLTYARLNTYCAEVTIVSDGANWQVRGEAMGQVPTAYSYLTAEQSNITGNTWVKVTQDAEVFDIGGNLDTADSKFVCPIPGKYEIIAGVIWKMDDFVVDKEYKLAIYKNGTGNIFTSNSAPIAVYLNNNILYVSSFAINDYIEMYVKYVDAASTQDIMEGSARTFLIVKLISKG